MTKFIDLTENIKVNEVNLSIDTFFMRKNEYNALSETNRKIAHEYIDSIAHGMKPKSEATVRYNGLIIRFMLRTIGNELDSLEISDINKLIVGINKWKKPRGDKGAISESTKKQYYIGIKRYLFWFAKWHKMPEYNQIAALIEVSGKAKPKKAKDMLTTSEIEIMINTANLWRDKAIIATLGEAGCRIGELLNNKVGDIVFTNHGCNLNITTSKTEEGVRVVPLGAAAYYIEQYLMQHPLKKDPKAPLWITWGQTEPHAMAYHTVRDMLKNVAKKAKIDKRIHPHLFRHSAATTLSKMFNEYELKKFMGWAPNSNVPATYVHLGDEDIQYAVYAKRYGLMEVVKNDSGRIVGNCPKCGSITPISEDVCQKCHCVLNQDLRDNVEKREKVISEAIAGFDKNTILSIYEMIGDLMKTNQS
jgi:integrase/recombinase XerD